MEARDALSEKLEELQDEYSNTKYSKATNKHLGILRAKIAKARHDIEESKKRRAGTGFFVKKSGDATIALVGFPSAGKSSLINELTGVKSKTAGYAFTTTTLIPGMLTYNDARLQIFDLPGIMEGAHIGAGGGRTVLAAAKISNLILFVIDATLPSQLDMIMQELRGLSIFINAKEPDIQIHENGNQGFKLDVNKSKLSKKVVETIFAAFNMYNSSVKINQLIEEDELIAFLSGKSCYITAVVALNKIDIAPDYMAISNSIRGRYGLDVVPISALNRQNLNALVKTIYNNLDIMTIHLQPKDGSKRTEIMILKKGATVSDAARKIHSRLPDEVKYAYINGPSARFRNQRVGTTHMLKDGDTLTFKFS